MKKPFISVAERERRRQQRGLPRFDFLRRQLAQITGIHVTAGNADYRFDNVVLTDVEDDAVIRATALPSFDELFALT